MNFHLILNCSLWFVMLFNNSEESTFPTQKDHQTYFPDELPYVSRLSVLSLWFQSSEPGKFVVQFENKRKPITSVHAIHHLFSYIRPSQLFLIWVRGSVLPMTNSEKFPWFLLISQLPLPHHVALYSPILSPPFQELNQKQLKVEKKAVSNIETQEFHVQPQWALVTLYRRQGSTPSGIKANW